MFAIVKKKTSLQIGSNKIMLTKNRFQINSKFNESINKLILLKENNLQLPTIYKFIFCSCIKQPKKKKISTEN